MKQQLYFAVIMACSIGASAIAMEDLLASAAENELARKAKEKNDDLKKNSSAETASKEPELTDKERKAVAADCLAKVRERGASEASYQDLKKKLDFYIKTGDWSPISAL